MTTGDVLDPTGKMTSAAVAVAAPRLSSLDGARVALIDNRKPNANLLLAALAEELRGRGVTSVHTVVKGTIAEPIGQDEIDGVAQNADFAIAAIGDCGSCTAGTASDSLVLQLQGIPAVSVCTTPFRATASAMARSYGLPETRFLFTQHPLASLSADELSARAADLVDELIRILTGAEG